LSLPTIEGELQRFGSDFISTIIRCFSHVMQISDQMELERLLTSSFEEVKSIDPRRLDDYAHRFISDIPPQPRRSIFVLTPLTATIVRPADMNIDANHCVDAEVLESAKESPAKSCSEYSDSQSRPERSAKGF
jgi:hypothetical protein